MKRGLLALSPIVVLLVVYLAMSLASGDFYRISISVAFVVAAVYAVAMLRGVSRSLQERIGVFSEGASDKNIMYMIWIFVLAGIFAGSILTTVYVMLTYMGMCSSGVYPIQENGAWTLRCIVYQLFGNPGAILLAAIFTLACLTTCIGLINSISQYFSTLFSRLSYTQWACVITVFSFFICNLGLNAILSISIPVLNAIYPVSIVLILLGLSHSLWKDNRYVYPLTVGSTTCVSVIYALDTAGLPLGFVSDLCRMLPLYDMGFCWVSVALLMLLASFGLNAVKKK